MDCRHKSAALLCIQLLLSVVLSTTGGNAEKILDACKDAGGYLDDIALGDEEFGLAVEVKENITEGKKTDKRAIGDIKNHRRGVEGNLRRRWEDGVIPYEVSQTDFPFPSTKQLFVQAMRSWENVSCLTFVPRQPEHKNFVIFRTGACGCCSFVGKRGGGQAINLGVGCLQFGIVMHEVGHAIGFWHEQSRPDRDNYVEILEDNIKAGQYYNFRTEKGIDSLGQPYDFYSVMHYRLDAFSANGRPVMKVRSAHASSVDESGIGNRIKQSEGDITQVNLMYNCPACGSSLLKVEGSFSSPSFSSNEQLCQWRISGKEHILHISLSFASFNVPCSSGYLEIRDGHYLRSPLIGRYCDSNVPRSILSSSNRLWIEYRMYGGRTASFSASYKMNCGEALFGSSGSLSSPGYPERYPEFLDCQWTITVSRGRRIRLSFDPHFKVEDSGCTDYIDIYDGRSQTARRLGHLCGRTPPADIITSGNEALVVFKTDYSINYDGFMLNYREV